MDNLKKYGVLTLAILLAGFGPSMTIKAAVGLGAFDALNQTIAFITGFRVGDVLTVLNLLFVVAQLLILKKEANFRILLQIPLSAIFGQIINFYFYNILEPMEITNYFANLALFIFGNVWVAFFITIIMALDLVTMPVENLAMVISKKIQKEFGRVRQWFDIIFILLALILTFIFSVPFTIREGTVIATLIFGPLISIFMPYVVSTLRRWHLIPLSPTES